MLDNIAQSLVETLEQAGLQAGRAWPRRSVVREGLYIRLSIASARQSEAGFSRFLGMETRQSDGAQCEVYGMRCEIGLRLDIYASPDHDNAAQECEKLMDDILLALAGHGGLSISSLSCRGAEFDPDTGMFLCPCAAEARAELIFRSTEETGEFTDFILKGELRR